MARHVPNKNSETAVRAPIQGGTLGVPAQPQAAPLPGPFVHRQQGPRPPEKKPRRWEVMDNPRKGSDGDWRVLLNHAVVILKSGRIVTALNYNLDELRAQGVKLKPLDPPDEEENKPEADGEEAAAE